MKDLKNLLQFLIKSPIDFVLVGGLAAVIHGCNQTTRDVDICILFSEEQLQGLQEALAPIHPRLKNAGDKKSLADFHEGASSFKTIHLETDLGILDVVSHIEGVGGFYDVLKNSERINIYGGYCDVISIDDLIHCKEALGRHRDLAVAEELKAIRKEK